MFSTVEADNSNSTFIILYFLVCIVHIIRIVAIKKLNMFAMSTTRTKPHFEVTEWLRIAYVAAILDNTLGKLNIHINYSLERWYHSV